MRFVIMELSIIVLLVFLISFLPNFMAWILFILLVAGVISSFVDLFELSDRPWKL